MSGLDLERVTLVGRHVTLEPLDHHHVQDLVAAASVDRSTFGFTWIAEDEPGMTTMVDTALAQHAAGTGLPFAIRHDGRVGGSTRIWDIEEWYGQPTPSAGEIGHTWLAPWAQRTAANTEAKLLLLTHAFETWGVLRITLKTDARNDRSRNAILRIGARFEGVRRAHMPAADGTIRDSAYYSILAAEWPEVKANLQARLT